MTLSDAIALSAVIVAIVAIPAAVLNYRSGRSSDRAAAFKKVIARLRTGQADLNQRVWESSPTRWKASEIPLLTTAGWVPDEPFELDGLRLEWRPDTRVGTIPKSRGSVPLESEFSRLPSISRASYSGALVEIAGMTHLFNGRIYRLLGASSDLRTMTFTEGRYFDYLDTSEVLAYESSARMARGKESVLKGKYRRTLKGPFDLSNRVSSLGVNTVTLRASDDEMTFFLHRRDAAGVAGDAQLVSVTPAGEFTPSDRTEESLEADFDLWRNIMREYAEEFLGDEESRGQGGHWIDYGTSSPYAELDLARHERRLRVHVLGMGLDPLSWKPQLLTSCILDGITFDTIFAEMLDRNEEGLLLHGRHRRGLPFDQVTVDRYLHVGELAASARACLQLAWEHRDFLRDSLRREDGR